MTTPEPPRPVPPAPQGAQTLATPVSASATPGTATPPAAATDTGFGPVFDIRASPSSAMSAVLCENWWAIAARGGAAILFGLFALLAPGATLISLALVFAVYLLIDGIFGIVAAIRAAQKDERWGLLVLEGVVDLAAGLAALVFPAAAVIAFVFVVALWALVSGGLMVVAALKLEKDHGRVWLVLGGAVSILLGIALAIAPLIGAYVLAWWIGGYALAFGGLLIALAFKLKSRRDAKGAASKPAA